MEEHNRIADCLKVLCHFMGVRFTTATHACYHDAATIPLKQRKSRNLCALHVFARAWMIATDQQDDNIKFTHDNVDTIRDYVLELVLSKDKRVCYPLTPEEKKHTEFYECTSTEKVLFDLSMIL